MPCHGSWDVDRGAREKCGGEQLAHLGILVLRYSWTRPVSGSLGLKMYSRDETKGVTKVGNCAVKILSLINCSETWQLINSRVVSFCLRAWNLLPGPGPSLA